MQKKSDFKRLKRQQQVDGPAKAAYFKLIQLITELPINITLNINKLLHRFSCFVHSFSQPNKQPEIRSVKALQLTFPIQRTVNEKPRRLYARYYLEIDTG